MGVKNPSYPGPGMTGFKEPAGSGSDIKPEKRRPIPLLTIGFI